MPSNPASLARRAAARYCSTTPVISSVSTARRGRGSGLALEQHAQSRIDCGGSDRNFTIALKTGVRDAADMPKMTHHRGAFGVHRFHDFAPSCRLLVVLDTWRTETSVALSRDESRFCDQKAPRGGSLLIVFHHCGPRHVAWHL